MTDERCLELANEIGLACGKDSTISPFLKHVLRFFTFGHLPPHLARMSAPFAELALTIARSSSNQETTMALRKLLEAKDCAVHALIPE
jgi:hypothetical protein